MTINSQQLLSDEKLKKCIRTLNLVVTSFFVVFIILLFVLFYLINNDNLSKYSLVVIALPLLFFPVLRQIFKSNNFIQKLMLRGDIRGYADDFLFVRFIYDDKALYTIVVAVVVVAVIAAAISTLI